MGVVHPGAPRPWLYLISERRARAPGAGVETVYPSAATYYHEAGAHPQLACEILINLRFSYFIAPQAKQRNSASLLTSAVRQAGSQGFPAYYTTD